MSNNCLLKLREELALENYFNRFILKLFYL